MVSSACCSSSSDTSKMTIPRESIPRRPARPDIWMYSAAEGSRKVSPSHLRSDENTTARAGMFSPSAKVSVAKSNRTRPSWKRISTTSLSTGSSPEWCTATPRRSSGSSRSICSTCWSASPSVAIAASKTARMVVCLTSESGSRPRACIAAPSHALREKEKMTAGVSCRSCSIQISFFRSGESREPDLAAAAPPAGVRSCCIATTKFVVLKTPSAPLRRRRPSPPAGKTQCSSGVGRLEVEITWHGRLCVAATQCANSPALGIVADKKTNLAADGSRMMHSSQITPRSLSLM
eukprot:scaffold14707_cov129-Isochrysis_galbana.AAC.13